MQVTIGTPIAQFVYVQTTEYGRLYYNILHADVGYDTAGIYYLEGEHLFVMNVPVFI